MFECEGKREIGAEGVGTWGGDIGREPVME